MVKIDRLFGITAICGVTSQAAMADVVEIPDDNSSDNEVQKQQPQTVAVVNHAFDELRSLKSEMESRGSLLGKTWSELSNIMTRYQAQIFQQHEQLDNCLSGADYFGLAQMESELERCRTDNVKLHKRVTDLESKILEKDSEIIQLRTDFHKANNAVMMKNNLINKIQAQMAQEALDYQTEIAALKDLLEQNDGDCSDRNFVPISVTSPQPKRRKISKPLVSSPQMRAEPSPRKQEHHLPLTNTPTKREPSSSSSISVKSESFQTTCQMSGLSTSQVAGQGDMDSSYQTTDQSFDDAPEGGGQEPFYSVGDVFLDSNLGMGMEGLSEGGDTSMQSEEQEEMWKEDKRRHGCRVCGKLFRRPHQLEIHMRTHTGAKPFQCLMCLKTFSVKSNATSHIKTVHQRFHDAQDFLRHFV